MRAYWRVLRRFDRSLWLYIAYWAIAGFCYFGVQSVILNLYLLRLGYGPEFIGLLVGSGQITWAAFALPAGAIGKRMGLREAQVLGLALLAASMGLFLVVEALPRAVWDYWLIACWIATWVAAALITVNSLPYLMAVASPEVRDYALPVQQALLSAMAFAGSLVAGLLPGILVAWLGGSLLQAAPFRWVLWLVPPAYAFGAILFSRSRRVTLDGDETSSSTAESARPTLLFVVLGLIVFLQLAGQGSARAFFNVYLDVGLRVDPAQIGEVMGVAQLLPILAVLAIPRLLLRLGAVFTLALASLGQAAALLLLAATPTWEAAALGFLGVMTMSAVIGPSRNLFSQEIVAPQWRTTTSAILTVANGLGWASTAAGGGYLVQWVGFGGLFVVSATLTAASAVLMLGLDRLVAAKATELTDTCLAGGDLAAQPPADLIA